MTTVFGIQHQGDEIDFSDAYVNTAKPWVFVTRIEALDAFEKEAGHRRLVQIQIENNEATLTEIKRV